MQVEIKRYPYFFFFWVGMFHHNIVGIKGDHALVGGIVVGVGIAHS